MRTDILFAALRHLEHSIHTDTDLSYLTDIVDFDTVGTNEIDELCQSINLSVPNSVARYVGECEAVDPDTQNEVPLLVYKEQLSGGLFAVDATYIDSMKGDCVYEPFTGELVKLEPEEKAV
jgi:hypothetical protein